LATSGARAPRAGTGDGLPRAGTGDGREHRMPALLGIFSARTWLALINLLAGAVTSTLAFLVVVTGVSVGVSLLPVFLAGLPMLLAVVWLCQQVARVERARFALLVGTQIPGPPPQPPAGSVWRGLWRYFTTASTWRFFGYVVFVWPLHLVAAIVITALWGVGLALLVLPAYNHALPGGSAHLGSFHLDSAAWMALGVFTGVVLLLGASPLTQAVAAGDAVIAKWLLGPGRADRARLTARIGELETSRAGVVDAAEAERRRIERDLHDGAQQRLVSLAMELGRARAKFASDPKAAEALVGQAHEQAKEALTELRNLVRGVHPPVLTDRGLDAALSGLAALSPVPVTVRVDLPNRPSAGVEAIAYFVVAEALTNVAKHAKASRALVTVSRSGDLLDVTVRDDGIGGADPSGRGLSGLAARAAAVDGRLLVNSPAGGPTVIEAVLPCG
jgi:signal transduction histidine kinase